jgi:NAD(P)-dependent dehydrogenase (short-subunit alcohol dehydrogenase family)
VSTWLITGCSTGLGRTLAAAVLESGDNAIVTARDAASVQDLVDAHPDTALAVSLDVTVPEQVEHAVTSGIARFGAIDVLVNNAGYGYRAAVEEGDENDVARLFDTNVHGAVRMTKAVLPGMRESRSGTIVNISSIGARLQPEGSGYYAATKAALEALTGSLRKELAPLGIRAFTIEPGAFRTDFAGRSLTQVAKPIADYADTAGRRRKEHDSAHGRQPGDPAKAAHQIIRVVKSDETPRLLLLGTDALNVVRSVLADEQTTIDAWEQVSASTDFDA